MGIETFDSEAALFVEVGKKGIFQLNSSSFIL
jgi:hypothetical protein